MFFLTECELSPTTTIAIEEGKFGKCVKLKREKRAIFFTPTQYSKIRDIVPRLRHVGFVHHVTDTKTIAVEEYNGARYVKFAQRFQKVGKTCFCYINLNDDEYQELLRALDKLDQVFPPSINVVPCGACHIVKKVTRINALGRTCETQLTPGQLQDVRENNKTAYNQLAWCCEYCGTTPGMDMPACGHCHRYNCRECEPNNFCTTCGQNMIYAV